MITFSHNTATQGHSHCITSQLDCHTMISSPPQWPQWPAIGHISSHIAPRHDIINDYAIFTLPFSLHYFHIIDILL
jgi:hypothetical protein